MLAWSLSLSVAPYDAAGQSPIVFMTADYAAPESRLVRFDAGVESFAVTAGTRAAFIGVTILDGYVLVADFQAGAIQRFSPSGNVLAPFALFDNPTFLESDSSGNVYTTHFSLGPPVATRFNSSGAVTQTYSHPLMEELAGVDADADGNVYVVDDFITKVLYKFAADGTFLTSVPLGTINPTDVAIDEAADRLYMADEFGGPLGIKVFDISGPIPILTGGIATPPTSNIAGVHFAAESGNILATDFGVTSDDPRGLEFSPSGTLLREYRPTGARNAWDITTFVPEPGIVCLFVLGTVGLTPFGRVRRD